jgi:ABC-type uncharacterized transport system substrate-binding protein
VFPDALTNMRRSMLAAFFLKNRMPSAAGWAPYAESGFLVSYGPDLLAAYRRTAYFVDRIIEGAKPADLPIEMPSTIEMIINRRTAAALHLSLAIEHRSSGQPRSRLTGSRLGGGGWSMARLPLSGQTRPRLISCRL